MTDRRIGLLGGTFDPIHLGHLIMAERAAEELDLDRVVFVPAQTPPHKLGQEILPSRHRVAMVRLAIQDNDRFTWSDLDLRSGKPSYTSELVTRVARLYPSSLVVFIAGSDSLRDFPTWHEPETILAHAALAIARRPGVTIDNAMLTSVPGLEERVSFFHNPLIDISSSSIRERVRAGLSIRYLVPETVAAYIADHRLYTDIDPPGFQ